MLISSQWTEHFFVRNALVKVVLMEHQLLVQDQWGDQLIDFDFKSSFKCQYDHYGNVIALVVEGSHKVVLAHDNPTILMQWEELLASKIHKSDFYKEYQPKDKVGEGLSATVHAAVHKSTHKKVAVKVFSRSKTEKSHLQLLSLQNEVSILRRLNGIYFPQLMGTYKTDKSYYIVYEWCEGVTLKEWVQRGQANQKDVKIIVSGLVEGLKMLQSAGIIHRDIKPENIIFEPKTKTIKIVDFGFATLESTRNHLYPNCGTPGYAAPQVLDKNKPLISPQVDIFSLGVTLYFMFFAKLPYPENTKNILVANKECRFFFEQTLMSKGKLYDLIRRTVCSLQHRSTLQEIANHPYLRGEETKIYPSCLSKHEIFSKMTYSIDELELINRKIEVKRQERMRRERTASMRSRSKVRNTSCNRSQGKPNWNRYIADKL